MIDHTTINNYYSACATFTLLFHFLVNTDICYLLFICLTILDSNQYQQYHYKIIPFVTVLITMASFMETYR